MNFTREPIIETVISAREGNKLKLTSTKKNSSKEYLVYAIEVVSFGQALFYRSGEPGNVFFIPMQDYEIEQVRQARMILKTPEEKAIKIAGGDQNKSKNSDKNKKTDKSKRVAVKEEKPKRGIKKVPMASEDMQKDTAASVEKTETKNKKGDNSSVSKEKTESVEGQEKKAPVKAPVKTKTARRSTRKPVRKTASTSTSATAEKSEQSSSLFSHLLRPPEGLISDNIDRYLTKDSSRETKEPEQKKSSVAVNEKEDEVINDPNLASEPPKPFETLEEKPKSLETPGKENSDQNPKEIESLSLKDRMKKVLSSGAKKSSSDLKE